MERDFFKRYVDEHRDAFENEALPPKMLGNILANLKEREEDKEKQAHNKRTLTYTWLAVACSLFLVAGAYLFVSQEADEVMQPTKQIASNDNHNSIAEPNISKTTESPRAEVRKVSYAKQLAVHRPKANPHQEIYDGLTDSISVASRLDAIIKANALTSLNDKMKTELCKTFSEDNNDNVRLAALEVLSKFSTDKYIQEQLVAGLSKQKDPVVQLELVKIMGNHSNPETTDKLIAMANNPFTVDAVKEQVQYALLTNNN